MLVSNSRGNYRFLKGIGAYSSGVVADPGYQIVHATLSRPIDLREGVELAAEHLRGLSRPIRALCAIELRSPRPFSFAGFAEFNESYRKILDDANLLVEGVNPIARTNVAPEVDPPAKPVLHAFSYTIPSPDANPLPTFVVAGAGELIDDRYDVEHIVRLDDTSDEAMQEKTACVLDHLASRLLGLGVNWGLVDVVNIYMVRNLYPLFGGAILPRVAPAARHGVRWHYARPPILGLEFEMDVRSVGMEFRYP